MKIGDKIVCIRNLEKYFTIGQKYTISYMEYEYKSDDIFSVFVPYGEGEFDYFAFNINPNSEKRDGAKYYHTDLVFSKYFRNITEERKKKLNKINVYTS